MKISLTVVLLGLIIACVVLFALSLLAPKNSTLKQSTKDAIPLTSSQPVVASITPGIRSDLSYVEVVGGANSKLSLLDNLGTEVAKGFFQSPLKAPQTGETLGNGISMLYFPKPNTGQYTLKAENIDSQGVQVLLYDREGNSYIKEFLKGSTQKSAAFKILFNKENSNLSTISQVYN